MKFDRAIASQRAHALTRPELDLAIHVVCSAFSSEHFPGVETLADVREMIEILAREKHRRDVHDTIVQASS